jgi:ketosteroid isomerase-like protein
MSQANVEILLRANAAFNRGDRDGAFADYSADVVWHDLQHAPDAPERVQGLPALRAIWDQWAQAFDDFTADIEEFRVTGDFVVAVTRWRAKGKGSGLALDLHAADIYEFSDGKIVKVTLGYPPDQHAALKAVGLAE